MLLRASKNSAELTKRAGLLGKAVGKVVGKPLGWIGKTVSKHPMGSIGVIGGTGLAAGGAAEGMRRASKGMEPPYPKQNVPGYYLGRGSSLSNIGR